MVKQMTAWCANKAAGLDGWTRSEGKHITPETLKPMKDMMVKTVESKTLEELLRYFVWPAPPDLRPITVTCQTYGETRKALNVVVQGCSLCLVTEACITGSWMEGLSQQLPEITTMADDRRWLYAVGTEKIRIREEATKYLTLEEVGNKFNSKKSTVATSLMTEQKEIKKVAKRQKSSMSQVKKTSGIPGVPRAAKEPPRHCSR